MAAKGVNVPFGLPAKTVDEVCAVAFSSSPKHLHPLKYTRAPPIAGCRRGGDDWG